MTRFVTTDDLTLVLNKAYALGKAAEAAHRISADLDEDKQNIKVADEAGTAQSTANVWSIF